MAAAVIRVLSFSKTTKALVSPSRLSAVPVQRYSADVSSTGETITHTGQVRLLDIWSIQLLSAVFRAKIGHVLSVVTINVLRKINCCRFFFFTFQVFCVQVFDAKDPKRVRFVGKQKEVRHTTLIIPCMRCNIFTVTGFSEMHSALFFFGVVVKSRTIK